MKKKFPKKIFFLEIRDIYLSKMGSAQTSDECAGVTKSMPKSSSVKKSPKRFGLSVF
jgi:hypothetical protein